MIHQYQLNGFNIVVDVYSGSVHSVDELAYDVISMYKSAAPEEITAEMLRRYRDRPDVTEQEVRECIADVAELERQGRLFSEDEYEDKASAFKNRNTQIKALCLHVAHTCNLNCRYCFAAQGNFHGQPSDRPLLMSFETGKRALDFLMEQSGNRRNLEVDFFGGEPLVNWEVCKKLIEYARSVEKERGKNFRFTLTTNGMLLDDPIMEFANRECYNVVLSLDGRKEIHDALRKTVDGRGSYDTVVPRFQKFAESRGQQGYYIRGTFTHNNVDFVEDIRHMADLGFTELSMEPVVCDPEDPCALTEEDFPELCRQYEDLAVEMLNRKKEGNPITFYHYMIDLSGGPCIYKRIAGCGSGVEYMAVTPWGDLYPCHQFVGEEAYLMGNIWDGVTNGGVREEFRECNVYARPDCRDCWAKLYCSGGCAANAYHASGSIRGVYDYGCRLFRKRMECAIMIQAAEAQMNRQD